LSEDGAGPAADPSRAAGGPPGGAGGGGDRERERSWTVLELLRWTTEYFQRHGIEGARLDAEVLLAHALETQRLRLYIDYEKPVLPDERERFRALVGRRARERVPVSLLLGEREFWSLSFRVTPDVLTPRPETETLVEAALARLPASEAGSRVLDLGTGSGVIALSIALERPRADVTATDISEAALQIAAENADRLQAGVKAGVESRGGIRLLAGDLFEPVAGERFDLIVSNPPYVARRDAGTLPPELGHEPERALFGGVDGLEVIRRLVAEAGDHLSPGGWLGIELAPEQAEAVERMLVERGFEEVERHLDLAKRPRVVGARWPAQ
jgi:release factor glutamine methyltransferase